MCFGNNGERLMTLPYFGAVNTFPILTKRLLPHLLCLALLTALSVFFYQNTISSWPSHIHAWTQGDRYALAIKFADTGLNLFKPRTFNLQTKEGITAVDLPLHDYAVGILMKISGSRSPMIFRLYTLLFSILGCWFLFRLARDASGSVAKGLVAVVFVFTCPVITYYQAGFIPSATSFSAAMMGYYFYFRYKKGLNISDLYWAIGLMALAALSRSPFNIFLFAMLLQQGIGWFQKRKIDRKEALAFVAAYSVIVVANLYKIWLAQVYGSQFLGQMRPASSFGEFVQLLGSVLERWSSQLFSVGHYILLAATVSFLMVQLFRKKADALTRQIMLQSILTIGGGLLYFGLMARQFVDHEYYFMDSLYPGVALLLVAGVYCAPFNTLTFKAFFGVLALLCLGYGTLASKKVQELKYTDLPSDGGEITRKNFIGAGSLLDSLGISRDAKILVMDAYSTNIPLIHLNRMGHTLLSTRRHKIEESLRWDFDFIAIQDIFLPSEIISSYPELLHQLERMGGNGRISVFRYNPAGQNGDLKKLLDIKNTRLESTLDFEPGSPAPFWKSEGPTFEMNNSTVSLLKKDMEFGPGFMMPIEQRPDFRRVLFEGSLYTENQGDKLDVVATVEGGGKVFYYAGYPIVLNEKGIWTKFQGMFELPPNTPAGQELKCYLWNPGGAEVYFDNLKVTLY